MHASPWLPSGFGSAEERRRQVGRAAERAVTPAVMAALREQDRHLPPSMARRANLDRLAVPGSVCVVTGQQLGLYLGPLYTIYKAATACVLARVLEAETGVPTVPLFWLQTEDHDCDEIDHCSVPAAGGLDAVPLGIRLTREAGDEPRASIAHRCLPASVSAANDELREALADLPFAATELPRFLDGYRPGASWRAAFATALAQLFADEGLVFLDPRDPALAAATSSVHRTAITRAAEIDARLRSRSAALAAAGFDAQVNLRPGTTLSFFHAGDARGPRHRLERRGDVWTLPGSEHVFTDSALGRVLDEDPLRFSTSALLRPILQDTLLPTAAYVGGPAEVSYFAQLQPLYELYGLPLPLVAPRARFRLVDSATRSLLTKLGLSAADLERSRAEVDRAVEQALYGRGRNGEGASGHMSGWASGENESVSGENSRVNGEGGGVNGTGHGGAGRPEPPEALRAALLDGFERRLAELELAVPGLDPNLARAVRRTRGTVERAVDRLTTRYSRALLARDRLTADRVARAARWLAPGGQPQERVYGAPYYYCRYGRAFHQRVLGAVDPFSPEPRDLDL